MRTTVTIDDEVFRQLKKRAADTGVPLSDLVNRALRESLFKVPDLPAPPPFRMVTFGRGQPIVDHTPAELSRALEEEDRHGLRDS
jgi:hypothetical protein